MALQLPAGSRFPRRGEISDTLPVRLVSEFDDLVGRIAAQGDAWMILEHFKGFFCAATGSPHYRSTSESWAATDLRKVMDAASESPALFLDAFYSGCEALVASGKYELPPVEVMNDLCREYAVPFEIRPPALVRLDSGVPRVPVPEPPPTVAESAASIIRASIQRAEDLLRQDRPREAVQEMTWILESIATVFKGAAVGANTVQGRYFNEIAKELRRNAQGTTLARVVEWCDALHGYLSSPTGGGVRHGMDLNSGKVLTSEEGRLFCNLILSYVTFLMAEHSKLAKGE